MSKRFNFFEFIKRCPQNFGWRRFAYACATIVIGVAVAILSLRVLATPSLSFAVLRFGVAANLDFVVDAACDRGSLAASAFESLAPLLSGSLDEKALAQMSPEAKAARGVMVGALKGTLPLILRSALLVSNNVDASGGAGDGSKNLLAGLLGIQPSTWNEWRASIMAGHFALGECREDGSRAACEVFVDGPNRQSVAMALLFERQSGFWRLKGIVALDRLLMAMRGSA
jgi:hypothetical protein